MTDQELVRAAAEKVMGWRYWDGEPGGKFRGVLPVFSQWISTEVSTAHVATAMDGDVSFSWNPLTSIADAWMLLGNLRTDLSMSRSDGLWRVAVRDSSGACIVGLVKDTSAPRAITIAALRAIGIEGV